MTDKRKVVLVGAAGTNARKIIGYEPQHNSEIRFQELIQAHIKAARLKGDV